MVKRYIINGFSLCGTNGDSHIKLISDYFYSIIINV